MGSKSPPLSLDRRRWLAQLSARLCHLVALDYSPMLAKCTRQIIQEGRYPYIFCGYLETSSINEEDLILAATFNISLQSRYLGEPILLRAAYLTERSFWAEQHLYRFPLA